MCKGQGLCNPLIFYLNVDYKMPAAASVILSAFQREEKKGQGKKKWNGLKLLGGRCHSPSPSVASIDRCYISHTSWVKTLLWSLLFARMAEKYHFKLFNLDKLSLQQMSLWQNEEVKKKVKAKCSSVLDPSSHSLGKLMTQSSGFCKLVV